MFIIPMNSNLDAARIHSFISGLDKNSDKSDNINSSSGFQDIFRDLISNVEKAEATTEDDAYKLAVGEMDDPHTSIINSAKAEMSLLTMVQIRNKVLDAYSEIMRINV